MSDQENIVFGVKVRIGEERDRAACREIMIQHHANTVFRDQKFSEQKFSDIFDEIVVRPPGSIGIVAEWNQTVLGFAYLSSENYICSEGPPFVAVKVIAVNLLDINASRRAKCFLALVSGVKSWVAQTGSTHGFINVTTGYKLESTHRLLLVSGAEAIGQGYKV